MKNKIFAILVAVAALALSGCATTDSYGYGSGYNSGYANTYGSDGYYGSNNNYRRSEPWSSADEGRSFGDGSRVVCRNVETAGYSRDPDRVGGTVAGAVIGGLIGNQIGSGSGRTAATAAGAIAGGAIGRNVQGRNQAARGERRVERVCERVWY